MTRKRFIKQLMAVGVSRRTAVHSAQAARAAGRSYDLVFRALMCWIYGQLITEAAGNSCPECWALWLSQEATDAD